MENDTNNKFSLQEIADRGAARYSELKAGHEPENKGKFLAIEVESGDFYLGEESIKALEQARKAHPGKLFYVVKIGSDSIETLAHSLVGRS
jgi:hypothetical protein